VAKSHGLSVFFSIIDAFGKGVKDENCCHICRKKVDWESEKAVTYNGR